jgi:hypothetical protein
LPDHAGKVPVWARKGVGLFECPKSLITAESIGWLEEFSARRRMGSLRLEDLGAREAEAFLMLGELLSLEKQDG